MKDHSPEIRGIVTGSPNCPHCGSRKGCEHQRTLLQIPHYREGKFGLGLGDFDAYIREIFYQAVWEGRFRGWSWRDRDMDRLWRLSREHPVVEPANPQEVRVQMWVLLEILANLCRGLGGEMHSSTQELLPRVHSQYLSFQWPQEAGRTTRELEDALCRAVEGKAARGMVRTIEKVLEVYARAVNTGETEELDEITHYPVRCHGGFGEADRLKREDFLRRPTPFHWEDGEGPRSPIRAELGGFEEGGIPHRCVILSREDGEPLGVITAWTGFGLLRNLFYQDISRAAGLRRFGVYPA